MIAPTSLQILAYGTYIGHPRGLFVNVSGKIAYLRCEFDALSNDYLDFYEVFVVRGAVPEDFYTGAYYQRTYDKFLVGRLLASEIAFDDTKCKSIKSSRLVQMLSESISPAESPEHKFDMAIPNRFQILQYDGFHDFPRGLFVNISGNIAYLRCEFDEILDDYRDYYDVYYVISGSPEEFYTGAYDRKQHDMVLLGRLQIAELSFDGTRRRSIESPRLRNMIEAFSSSANSKTMTSD